MRDNQRSRVYSAEKLIETRDYAGMVLADHRVRQKYGVHKVEVKDGRGQRRALAWGDTISMPRWSRHPAVILHELAHCLAPSGVRHGPRFCRVYLNLVLWFLGEEYHQKLKEAFEAKNVKVWGTITKKKEQHELAA